MFDDIVKYYNENKKAVNIVIGIVVLSIILLAIPKWLLTGVIIGVLIGWFFKPFRTFTSNIISSFKNDSDNS